MTIDADALARLGLRVKPLIFTEFQEGGCVGRPYPMQYFITQAHDGRFLCHWDETWHLNLCSAQEHAQSHYRTAALETVPHGRT